MKDTHDLELIREYPVKVARLWAAVTRPEEVAQWFGTEGMRMEICEMDLTRTGPWVCVMVGKDSGDRFKVSGQVTHVRPPQADDTGSVGFTWGWHDDNDNRGAESHVTFAVAPTETGARLTLTHRQLDTLEASQSHGRGWLSTLNKLDRMLA
ncbi:SRPBCC family protein [Microbulbifer sp. S227A]|uniref:SRPBCC family protein n=1 Tax=Microbulbifer sp. S227A TaxID=3415131 RepID=UPI003C7C1638